MADRANVWNGDGGEFPSNQQRCSAMWGKNNFVFRLLLGRCRRRRRSRQMQIEFLLPIRSGRRWVCTSRTHFGQNHRHHWCLPHAVNCSKTLFVLLFSVVVSFWCWCWCWCVVCKHAIAWFIVPSLLNSQNCTDAMIASTWNDKVKGVHFTIATARHATLKY